MVQAAYPFAFDLPRWLTLNWTLRDVLDVVGSDTEIQYQAHRLSDPLYEMCSPNHRQIGRFIQFVAEIETGEANDVYLTAQNSDHPQTAQALAPVLSMCKPVPAWLGNTYDGFIWLGRGTMTPLHYDKTHNTMCQLIGEKHVRMFSPDQTDRLDDIPGTVHSTLGWVGDDIIAERSLLAHDVYLKPGIGVYIPKGWWHCVRTPEVSMTVVFAQR